MPIVKRVTIKVDNVGKVVGAINDLVGKQVLIGIPSKNAARKDGGPMNNAAIGYVMEFGSPSQNIPARAWLIPGVEHAEAKALAQLRKAADAALVGESKLAEQKLNAAGVIGANSVIAQINSNIPPPLSPATIRNRRGARNTQSRRPAEERYAELIKGGMPPAQAQSEAGIVALVNTGSMRNAVTYVVEKK
jgi:hypothetical protein